MMMSKNITKIESVLSDSSSSLTSRWLYCYKLSIFVSTYRNIFIIFLHINVLKLNLVFRLFKLL